MVKLLGAVMTGLSCGYFGFRLSASLKKRIKSLWDIVSSLELLESEIAFSAQKLQKAFINADRNGLFTAAAAGIEEHGVKKAWRNAVREKQKEYCLTAADCEALYMLADNIGKTDADNQIKHIKYVKTAVSGQAAAAQSEYDRFGRVYRNGGVLIGLMIVIILA